MKKILFVCTGNYYRSRFAEALFNHHAQKRKLRWRAFSRGLATHLIAPSDGVLSRYTEAALKARHIPLSHTGPEPVQLTEKDLLASDRVIALKEAEHRTYMMNLFPEWSNRIGYWHVHDLDAAGHEIALPQIEKQILEIVMSLEKPRRR